MTTTCWMIAVVFQDRRSSRVSCGISLGNVTKCGTNGTFMVMDSDSVQIRTAREKNKLYFMKHVCGFSGTCGRVEMKLGEALTRCLNCPAI